MSQSTIRSSTCMRLATPRSSRTPPPRPRAPASGRRPNALFRVGPTAWRALRHSLFDLLKEGAPPAGRGAAAACLVPREDAIFKVAVDIGDYTDF